jgi:hypothetical protein
MPPYKDDSGDPGIVAPAVIVPVVFAIVVVIVVIIYCRWKKK